MREILLDRTIDEEKSKTIRKLSKGLVACNLCVIINNLINHYKHSIVLISRKNCLNAHFTNRFAKASINKNLILLSNCDWTCEDVVQRPAQSEASFGNNHANNRLFIVLKQFLGLIEYYLVLIVFGK